MKWNLHYIMLTDVQSSPQFSSDNNWRCVYNDDIMAFSAIETLIVEIGIVTTTSVEQLKQNHAQEREREKESWK